MVRMFVYGLVLSGLLCLMTALPARAQDAAANVARAQQTLTEITKLLDAIQARQAALAQGRATGGATAETGNWKPLFDGKSLAGWKRTNFSGGGEAHVDPNFRGGPAAIVVDAGDPLSGITWTSDMPKTNYEITLEAMKIDGNDFMCGLTFPVGDSYASLILGGWGGGVAGISSIENQDASENETSRTLSFPKDHWFKIRMRVTPAKLETWLDDKKIVDVNITGKKISLRFGEISKSVPLGLATYQTSAAYRAIKLHQLETP
ncbi:MAG TPA: DUF1080 domain-containing protein [Chthonomonadaceae bacterium]|nr:DUF1080 domain-containing protein [Chthonomonadaceae bacterium]